MEVGKKYAPPYCPEHIFFLGKSLDKILHQNILTGKENKIAVGIYNYDSSKIHPVKDTSIDKFKVWCRSNPEEIVVAPLENIIELQTPLVQGRLDIYQNWEKFAIEDIRHPLGNAYISGIDATVLRVDYKKTTKDEKTGQDRYEFVGGSEEFDPIVRGFATWNLNRELSQPYGPSNMLPHFVILLESAILKKISRYFRNKKIQSYGDFLNRVAKSNEKIRAFLEYSNQWALKQRKGKK